MSLQIRFNRSTIANSSVTDKNTTFRVRSLATWLIAAFGAIAPSPLAFSLPVTIAWDVPLKQGETYNLEIADTPGFAKSLFNTEVKGNGYLWQAPDEGVYHWRLTRPGRRSESASGVETSSLASGSFAIVDPALKRDQAARLSWDPVSGADKYKIYFLDAEGKQSINTVTTTYLIIPEIDSVATFEVVPFQDEHRLSRTYQLTPSLKLDSGRPPAPPSPSSAPPPEPLAVVTKTTILVGDQTDNRRLKHRAQIFAGGVDEQFKFNKLGLQLSSEAIEPVGGASLWLNPVAGFIVSGAVDYHEHRDRNSKQTAVYGNQTLSIDPSRYSAEFSLGYNLLDLFGVERVIFTLAAGVAATQLPLVQESYSPTLDPHLPLVKEHLYLLGGSASIGYLGSLGSVIAEAGGYSEVSHKGRYKFARLWLEGYPVDRLVLSLGGFFRTQEAATCASDRAECLLYGESHTQTNETGFLLGIGSVIR